MSDLIVSYDFLPKIGGAHLWLYEVYRRCGRDTRVLTVRPSPEHSDEAAREREFDGREHGSLRMFREASPIGDISLLSPACLRAFRAHVKALARLSPSGMAHVHALRAFPEGITACLYRKLHPRTSRLITYAHGEEVLIAQTSLQLKLLARWVYASSDLVIVNSESTRKLVLALCPTARTVCIHPGVDVASFVQPQPRVDEYRARWNWPSGTVVACTVARMEPRKNHAMLIRAVAELRKQNCPVAYVCGGDGPERSALATLARELNIEEWVRFTGAVSDDEKQLIYAGADIYAMPSIQLGEMLEGFGIVFLEAAAAGLPSICGNSGGQPEAVLHERTGLVVDGARLEDVSRAIKMLCADPQLRDRMGRAGRDWAAQHDWSRIATVTREEIDNRVSR